MIEMGGVPAFHHLYVHVRAFPPIIVPNCIMIIILKRYSYILLV